MSGTNASTPFRLCLGFTIGLVALLTACVYFHWPAGVYVKMAASTGFLATAIAGGAFRSIYGAIIFAGLVFSWWGDLFLNSSGGHFFLLGLVAFLLAHLAYSAAFLVHGVRATWAAVGLALAALFSVPVALWLYPHLGEMRYPVLGYITVITLMVALSIGAQGNRVNRWMVAGAILFYVSDLFVARQRFATPSLWNPLIGLPVYFTAQLLLASSIARRVNREPQIDE